MKTKLSNYQNIRSRDEQNMREEERRADKEREKKKGSKNDNKQIKVGKKRFFFEKNKQKLNLSNKSKRCFFSNVK